MNARSNLLIPKVILYLTLVLSFLSFVFAKANAQTMSNENYILNADNLNTSTIKPINPNSKPKTNNEKVNLQNYGGINYKVKANPNPFSFSISETLTAFGPLTATNPVSRSINLTTSGNNIYSIILYQNHPLKTLESSIPDTTCDNGSCSEFTSSTWTNTLTYGLGYRCDGQSCVNEFSDSTHYKQLPDSSTSESPQIVISGINKKKNNQAKITYKLNISNTQPPGNYSNLVTFIAIPGF